MHVLGKRLSALLVVIGIAILGVAMLPQINVEASSAERERSFSSERGEIDWESAWANRRDGRAHRGGPDNGVEQQEVPAPVVPAPDESTEPAGDTTPAEQDESETTAPSDQGESETTTPSGDEDTATTTPSDEGTASLESGSASLDSIEAEVLDLINAHRQENGLAPLENNSALNSSSNTHSQDMADNGYFSHTSLDGSSPFDRMPAAGYSCGTMGENIAAGQTSAQ